MSEKKIPKHEKMYANSPTLETDKDGKKYIKKNMPTEAEKKTSEQSAGIDGIQKHESGMPMEVRHSMERGAMHTRHETEHMMHKGDKKEMHGRHEKEMKDMHGRHEKEATGGEGLIKKVESGKKE